MSLSMEPMKVPLRMADAKFCMTKLRASPSHVPEPQQGTAELAKQNALLLQQNEFLMRKSHQLEEVLGNMQLHRILAGPPGLTMQPPQHPILQVMAAPSALTKEPVSNHSDVSTACSACDEVSSDQSASEEEQDKQFTQIIVKNLRSDFTRAKLLNFLETVGYKGTYDMVYLPTSFDTGRCYQFAFVNFLTQAIAQQFEVQLQGFVDEDVFGEQICEVSWSDCQGLSDSIEKYRNSPMMHPSVPDECKPVLFVDGKVVSFPAPTKKISKPRLNRRTR